MTGYAQARVEAKGWSIRVTLRSVNHRFLDLQFRIPEGFEPLEPKIRQILRERVRRGHLDVTVHYDLAGPAAVGVNEDVAVAYLQAVNSVSYTHLELPASFRKTRKFGAFIWERVSGSTERI